MTLLVLTALGKDFQIDGSVTQRWSRSVAAKGIYSPWVTTVAPAARPVRW
jgi:hypothetical protein